MPSPSASSSGPDQSSVASAREAQPVSVSWSTRPSRSLSSPSAQAGRQPSAARYTPVETDAGAAAPSEVTRVSTTRRRRPITSAPGVTVLLSCPGRSTHAAPS